MSQLFLSYVFLILLLSSLYFLNMYLKVKRCFHAIVSRGGKLFRGLEQEKLSCSSAIILKLKSSLCLHMPCEGQGALSVSLGINDFLIVILEFANALMCPGLQTLGPQMQNLLDLMCCCHRNTRHGWPPISCVHPWSGHLCLTQSMICTSLQHSDPCSQTRRTKLRVAEQALQGNVLEQIVHT